LGNRACCTRKGEPATEDRYAYFREAHEFRNYAILELPHFDARTGLLAATSAHERDFATLIARNFMHASLMMLVWNQLQTSSDETLSAIAQKSLKETRYHFRASRDWVVRLGDGTDESHARIQAAFDALWRYSFEFFTVSAFEKDAVAQGVACDVSALKAEWLALIESALTEATLKLPTEVPVEGGFLSQGKDGVHSVHLSYLLAEMQSLARAHPQGVW
jgi:ring-1,2-phenylacetyl-CoA epoxidase subunit PaaC